MDQSLTVSDVFSWGVELTSQQDYHGLTHTFLQILKQNSKITNAVVYEIHNPYRKIADDTLDSQLIRRFPLDFTKENDEYNEVIDKYQFGSEITLGHFNIAGFYDWIILAVKGGNGPNRIVYIEGKIDSILLDLLANLRLFYQNLVILHDGKERDVLTTLPNRQSLDMRLLQICEHYSQRLIKDKQAEKSSWLAVLDIDHFKHVNDNFGHLYGDEVLLIFSQLMSRSFRYNDFLFRYGGEEFVVIVNLATQEGALATFNRFRETLANYHFATVGQVTVSIGVTHIGHLSMPSTLLDHADKALYYAKEHGRNQVVLYEEIAHTLEDESSGDIELF